MFDYQDAACARLENAHGASAQLLGVKLSGDVRGLLFEACVEQRFRNTCRGNAELIYTFPLPWGAVLLGVDVLLGEQRLSGEVVEKRQAEASYEDALSEGDAAIMLERNHDHSYTLNLGNLATGEDCTITLRYAQVLQFAQGGLRLLIPTVIAPRFGDAVADGGMQPLQAPEPSLLAEHPFALELRVHGALAQARIASPSHPVSVALSATSPEPVLSISLARSASLDRDFVLVIDQLAHTSIAIAAPDYAHRGQVALLASFCPQLPNTASAATAVKILVDCSGSMAGDSMHAAQRALHAIVAQLDAGERFSLSRFGSNVEHRSRGLWKLSPATRRAAARWIEALAADMGGTEMQAALSSTLALAGSVSSDVLLITDGEIHAIDRTIEAARASGQRLFIVGIGSSPAQSHLHRLAEATGGACDFVAPGEAVEPAVLRMFARLRSPHMQQLQVQWPEGLQPDWVAPLSPAVFHGDTVNVFALFPQLPQGALEGAVQLLGASAGQAPQVLGSASLPSNLHSSDSLSRLAAATRLKTVATPDAGSALAVAYQLVTEHTNFLLLHQRPDADKAQDMPEQVAIAPMLPAGWGGSGSVLAAPAASNAVAPAIWPTSRVHEAAASDNTDLDIPMFLRRQNWSDDEAAQPSHLRSPQSLSQWLQLTPHNGWPTSYAQLLALGISQELLNWLELVIAPHANAADAAGATDTEAQVVAAFLHVMAQGELYQALHKTTGSRSGIKTMLTRWRKALKEMGTTPAPVNQNLVQLLLQGLQGMTTEHWPAAVLGSHTPAEEHLPETSF